MKEENFDDNQKHILRNCMDQFRTCMVNMINDCRTNCIEDKELKKEISKIFMCIIWAYFNPEDALIYFEKLSLVVKDICYILENSRQEDIWQLLPKQFDNWTHE